MSSRHGWEEALAGTLMGLALLGLIIAIAATVWCLVRLANLTARAWAKNPRCLPLWAAILALLASLALAAITQAPVFVGFCLVCAAILAIVARCLELYYAEMFEQPPSAERLQHDVLHEWWLQAA